MRIDLSKMSWRVAGWRPYAWQLARSSEPGSVSNADIAPVSAVVPGSVQAALRIAGLIPDWREGLGSLGCEWVENRHWEFFTDIEAGVVPAGARVVLRADGLDYAGSILVDNSPVADFRGALVRHRFDLSGALADGRAHRLGIVFHDTPREQGQIGFSSRSRFFKPRFSYGWDWCPRFVPIGIWDDLSLVIGEAPVEVQKVTTRLADDRTHATVTVWLEGGGKGAPAAGPGGGTLRLELTRGDVIVAVSDQQLPSRCVSASIEIAHPDLWYPNGHGEQSLYRLRGTLDAETVYDGMVGFKSVQWRPNPGAPAGAIPWVCVVNGRDVFLAGVNWTPIALDFHSVDEARYRHLVGLYRELGCTVLRVWGGAYLEREIFYRLCDEAGLMVWQEFPLSSSGIENDAPSDPDVVAELCAIARDYVRRRSHHVSLLLWCGGNELFRTTGSAARPLTSEHPCLGALAGVVREEDPGRRFLPTSPSGPVFGAEEADYGKGIHHHVHGPWGMAGSFADWERYWTGDDSTFRSEVGMPGASPAALIRRFSGGMNPWPPNRDNPLWVHGGAWWIQWDRLKDMVGELDETAALEKYCALSQDLQARALSFAAAAVKARFPSCGGFIVWMGHDCFPCTANTSIIDVEGNPKPAYWALREVFRR